MAWRKSYNNNNNTCIYIYIHLYIYLYIQDVYINYVYVCVVIEYEKKVDFPMIGSAVSLRSRGDGSLGLLSKPITSFIWTPLVLDNLEIIL